MGELGAACLGAWATVGACRYRRLGSDPPHPHEREGGRRRKRAPAEQPWPAGRPPVCLLRCPGGCCPGLPCDCHRHFGARCVAVARAPIGQSAPGRSAGGRRGSDQHGPVRGVCRDCVDGAPPGSMTWVHRDAFLPGLAPPTLHPRRTSSQSACATAESVTCCPPSRPQALMRLDPSFRRTWRVASLAQRDRSSLASLDRLQVFFYGARALCGSRRSLRWAQQIANFRRPAASSLPVTTIHRLNKQSQPAMLSAPRAPSGPAPTIAPPATRDPRPDENRRGRPVGLFLSTVGTPSPPRRRTKSPATCTSLNKPSAPPPDSPPSPPEPARFATL